MEGVHDEIIYQCIHSRYGYRFTNLLYAYYVFLMHYEISIAQYHVDCIRSIGEQYGLQFNENKLEVLAINSYESIVNDHNMFIEPKMCI